MKPIDAVLHILREEGVDRVFGNPGTTELPLIDALAGVSDMDYMLAVHELTAVSMADGYARATRRPSFVNLHVAAGVANGLLGMLDALRSRTPMVITAGQQDRRHLVQDPMLSGDLVGLATPAVKHAVEVQHARDLPVLLRRAFALARTPPEGPVFLSIPMDLLAEETEVDVLGRSTLHGPGVATGIGEAAEVLAAARRPAIVAGDAVGRDGVIEELTELAEALGATVYHQPMFDGVDFPGTHPLSAGMLPPTNVGIRTALAAHDLVFVVGCHAFMPHHYTPGPAVPEGTTVVQLDTDQAEIGRNFAVRAGLVGALGPTLTALTDTVGRVPDAASRLEAARVLTETARADVDAEALAAYGDSPLDPLAAAHAIAAGLPVDAVVVEEAITVGLKLRRVLRPARPRSYVHTVGGGLGWGIGAAIGTRLGAPDRPVVAVLGDGCTMFGIQGLWSAARYNVPVAFVVMNNGEYRTLKETLDNVGGTAARLRRYPGLDLAPPTVDWTAAGKFFGIAATKVTSAKELRDTIAGVGELAGPLLVDVPIRSHAVEHGYGGGS
ncbi:thiamine pyrophosphate-binding protein [Actinocrispum wychmicini]|uniref:Benzoylformate decarboxylase n=1 Tax=Actinocrispum wychmicini TaxID=1213861 RepID=A0A4R2JEY9_9PSEU|nr:thiamine pyrophosphate-binding protein [Actinocrispum wychmicini]TCO54819.1 benzoylformate decarboxylase [Actinocrispum wychmicini]